MKKDTLDVSWIEEEEMLHSLSSIPPKEPLLSIRIRVCFVHADSSLETVLDSTASLDISGNCSILPKETLRNHIQEAKEKYLQLHRPGSTDSLFSLEDILLWNAGVDIAQLPSYAEFGDPSDIEREFLRGSLSYDTILSPSLFIFHSLQCIYVFLREKPLLPSAGSLPVSAGKKRTKRVRFASTPVSSKAYTRRTVVSPPRGSMPREII